MTPKKTIGFIGGCAITQRNIPKEKRFIEVIKSKAKSKHLLVPSFVFSSYTQFSQCGDAVQKILNKQDVDFLILHIRPQPLLIQSKFVIKYPKKNGGTSFLLNPLITRNQIASTEKNQSTPVFNQLVKKPQLMGTNLLFWQTVSIKH